MATTYSTERAAYTAGLRRIADALDADDTLPLPYTGVTAAISVFTETKEKLLAWSRVLEGRRDKDVTDDLSYGFQLRGTVGGITVLIYAPREQVCTARVVGTETVIRQVPTVFETVTETRDVINWECGSLLAEVQS